MSARTSNPDLVSTVVDDRRSKLVREGHHAGEDDLIEIVESIPSASSRADRLAAAHAWVLANHAETFAKLAK